MSAQIEFSKYVTNTDLRLMTDGLFTEHSVNDDEFNTLFFTIWTVTENINDVSSNVILKLHANNKIEAVHISPLESEKYNIGSDEYKWNQICSSYLETKTIQTKTVNLYSGN